MSSRNRSLVVLVLSIALSMTVFVTFASAASFHLREAAKLKEKTSSVNSNEKKTPTGNLTLIADGFTWAENLWFDGLGGLWVNDDMAGKIYKITRSSFTAKPVKQLWLEGFDNALGLSNVYGQPTKMYAVVKLKSKTCKSDNGKSSNNNGAAVISFDINTPGFYSVALCTPVLGNGFAVNTQNTKGTIYSANEGGFLPKKGIVFESDPATQASRIYSNTLDAADGVFLDQETQLLYNSEVLEGHILVYNVSGDNITGALPSLVTSYKAPGCKMVDDFCIAYLNPDDGSATSTAFMYAADFWNDNVVAFPAIPGSSSPPKILAAGFYSPTSVRQGRGQGWDRPGSLYVTEGGGFIPELQKNRRVWELHL